MPTSFFVILEIKLFHFMKKTCFVKLHKKEASNVSAACHNAIKSFSCCESFDGNHECLSMFVYHVSSTFLLDFFLLKYFSLQKAHVLRTMDITDIHFCFRSSLGRFFNENYQVINVFNNPLCSVLSRINFVQLCRN